MIQKLTLEKLIEKYDTTGACQVHVYPHEVIAWVFREMNGASLDELIADAKARAPMSPEEIKEQRENFAQGQAMSETTTQEPDDLLQSAKKAMETLIIFATASGAIKAINILSEAITRAESKSDE